MSLWKKKPNRHPKVIPPANKRTPVVAKPEPIIPAGPKFYTPPERSMPRKKKEATPILNASASGNVLALPRSKSNISTKREQKRQTEQIRDAEKEFLRIFKQLTYMHSPWEVWHDFILMFACAISNSVDTAHFSEREALYMKTIEKYSEKDQKLFSELTPETVMALEINPEQDFLGKLYMTLELQNDHKAQFFTPYSVCQLMSEITLGNLVPEVKTQGYVTINDPCCGAGATLIASIHTARRVLEKEGINFQDHILVTGQDVDSTVALMCYIQLSLLGMAGYVKIGNSLTDPMVNGDSLENYWFTPIYFSDVWTARRIIRRMESLFEER